MHACMHARTPSPPARTAPTGTVKNIAADRIARRLLACALPSHISRQGHSLLLLAEEASAHTQVQQQKLAAGSSSARLAFRSGEVSEWLRPRRTDGRASVVDSCTWECRVRHRARSSFFFPRECAKSTCFAVCASCVIPCAGVLRLLV